jgi:hypothetical protein
MALGNENPEFWRIVKGMDLAFDEGLDEVLEWADIFEGRSVVISPVFLVDSDGGFVRAGFAIEVDDGNVRMLEMSLIDRMVKGAADVTMNLDVQVANDDDMRPKG